jgi:hypothetical protein
MTAPTERSRSHSRQNLRDERVGDHPLIERSFEWQARGIAEEFA